MGLTKEETLILTANLWNLIYHRGYEEKYEAMECLINDYTTEDILYDCPCCEYVTHEVGVLVASSCAAHCLMYDFFKRQGSIPDIHEAICEHVGSPYHRWHYVVGGGQHGKSSARKMRDGALECLEELWVEI